MVNNFLQTAVSIQSQVPRVESTVSEAVVEAVADAEGVPPSEVHPPLYDALDPDALDDLFAARSSTIDRQTGRIVFPYAGYEVTVHSGGHVSIIELADSERIS